MLGLFRWRELTITNDFTQFSKDVAELKQACIPYRVKMQHMGHANRRNGMLGGVGENPEYGTLYQILVRRSDLEQAKHLCRK